MKRTLLVLPTGTGKTVCFAELARRILAAGTGRVLVLAHRTELIEQAARKFADIGMRVSIEQGDQRASTQADVVIASVQTLRGPRLKRFGRDHFALVIIDEAHHAPAQGYQTILDHFITALVLGVTATPKRADGKALGKTFETVAYTYDMRQAIREGFLVPLRARRILVGDIDLTSIKSHHGDFDQGELARVFSDEKALHAVVAPLMQLTGTLKTLVFGVDVAHAHRLAEVINRHRPASAIAIDGTASKAERAATLAMFERGTFQYLVNCALFTEGFDMPSIECIALARPTQSWVLHTQMIGRGTRPSPATGKRDCLILDFVGNSKHRLITPLDALAGGPLEDDARDLAEASLDGQTELDDVLAHVDDEIAARRTKASLVAIAHYRAKNIDPFLGDFIPPLDPNSPSGRAPATEKQIARIVGDGIGLPPPPGWTKAEASQLIDALIQRDKLGLATIPQCQLLLRVNVDVSKSSKARAGQLIAMCRTRGFKPWVFAHEPEFRRTARKS